MIKGDEFKRMLIDKFGSIKDAAERIETTEQNLHKLIRNNHISTKILDRLATAMRTTQSEILKKIGTNQGVSSYNINTITNTVKENSGNYQESDLIKQLRAELSQTKEELLKCKDELIDFYRKELKK